MKFTYKYASQLWSNSNKKEIELNTLEELMEFIEDCDEDIIISQDKTIIIYDDYIE